MQEIAFNKLSAAPVIPVVALEDAAHAAPLSTALLNGGLRAIEITLRTPAALAAISQARNAFSGIFVGAGTVTSVEEMEAAVKAGAEFIVSPGFSPEMVQAAEQMEVALLPGVSTASEIMAARNMGLYFLKFFPAEAMGGISTLTALGGPFANTGFCPTGGITPANAPNYLSLPNVVCVGGSWITPKETLEAEDWSRVTMLAQTASAFSR